MSRRSSVSAVRAVSCPAECDQFRLASCKAPRPSDAPLSLRIYARERIREKERERERKVFSHERARSSHPLALRVSSTLSFFLLLSLFLLSRESPSFLMQLSLFLSFLIFSFCVLRNVIAHESLLGLAHFPPLSRQRSFFFLGDSRILRYPFSFLPSSYSPAGASFSIRVHTRESVSPPQPPPPPPTVPPSPFSSFFFVPVDRGVLHSSNLNAGRTGVLYRLRK